VHKSVRQYARADIELPPGWNSSNTDIIFTVTVKRNDTHEKLDKESIDVETTDYNEEDILDEGDEGYEESST
jgi:hypothetical protein